MEKKVWKVNPIAAGYFIAAIVGIIIGVGLISIFFTGCVLTPPTPVPDSVKEWTFIPLERKIVEPQPGDQELVQLPVGQVRQAVLDSESLDPAIVTANTASSELVDMNSRYNNVAKYARRAPLLGAVQSAIYFIFGGIFGAVIAMVAK